MHQQTHDIASYLHTGYMQEARFQFQLWNSCRWFYLSSNWSAFACNHLLVQLSSKHERSWHNYVRHPECWVTSVSVMLCAPVIRPCLLPSADSRCHWMVHLEISKSFSFDGAIVSEAPSRSSPCSWKCPACPVRLAATNCPSQNTPNSAPQFTTKSDAYKL